MSKTAWVVVVIVAVVFYFAGKSGFWGLVKKS